MTKLRGQIILQQPEESNTSVNDKCNRAQEHYIERNNQKIQKYNLQVEQFNNTCAKKYNLEEFSPLELDVGLVLTKTGSGCY